MPINLNFGEVGKLPAEGTKLVKCIKAKATAGKQAPYIALQFELLGPDMPGFKNLFLNLSCADQSLWATQRNLEALTGREYRNDNMVIDETEFPGLICGAIVTIGEYQGVERPEIQNLVPAEVAEEAMADYVPPDDEEPQSSFGMEFTPSSAGSDEEPF